MKLNKLSTSIAIALSILTSCGGGNGKTAEKPTYVPTEEFAPAYNALVKACSDKGFQYQSTTAGDTVKTVKVEGTTSGHKNEYYDIEETVRILNGLELAQMQSKDFYSFLEYMARQDYSMVPDEVISAKMELIPILQDMFVLEQENEEIEELTSIFNCLGTGLYAMAKDINLDEFFSGVMNAVSMTAGSGTPIGGIIKNVMNTTDKNAEPKNSNIQLAKTAAFDYYEEQHAIKEENSKKIAELKASYLDYLNKFTPIFTKYINEWDLLNIEKDKAYLAVWSGRSTEGYSISHSVLQKYPGNREMMLLKSLACINLAKETVSTSGTDSPSLAIDNGDNSAISQKYRFTIEAENILCNYINLYPAKSAPALVLIGELEMVNGNYAKAISYFDQAAIEYPKQADELKDMLNSYKLRNYLNATPEGKYLMRLYCSTMEGYGWFSPNFHKALYWDSMGESGKASTEIYNHFFRRGNQGLYDCLLTDMEFCEKNIHRSFKSQFMESSVLNVTVEEDSHMFGDNGIIFTLTNNSDINLENVRLYICLHLKGMYTDEYEVVPCDAINKLAPNTSKSWPISGYNFNDVVRARAILMTDDRVCWVDDITYKQSLAKRNYYALNGVVNKSLDMFEKYNLSEDKIVETLKSKVKAKLITSSGILQKMKMSSGESTLNVEMPRVLCLIDPVFSIGELSKNCTPSAQKLQGSSINLEFKRTIDQSYEPIYLYSDFINLKFDYEVKDGNVQITDISKI